MSEISGLPYLTPPLAARPVSTLFNVYNADFQSKNALNSDVYGLVADTGLGCELCG